MSGNGVAGVPGMRDDWHYDFGAILVCAERYSILRSSYMPELVADYIRRNLRHDPQSRNTAAVLARDIRKSRNENARYREEHPELGDWYCGIEDFEALLPMLDEVAKEDK